MQRFLRTHVCIDEDSMHKLNRLRRGTQLTLARLLTAIVQDYLDGLQHSPSPPPNSLSRERSKLGVLPES